MLNKYQLYGIFGNVEEKFSILMEKVQSMAYLPKLSDPCL
jgi:hypothetical protein